MYKVSPSRSRCIFKLWLWCELSLWSVISEQPNPNPCIKQNRLSALKAGKWEENPDQFSWCLAWEQPGLVLNAPAATWARSVRVRV